MFFIISGFVNSLKANLLFTCGMFGICWMFIIWVYLSFYSFLIRLICWLDWKALQVMGLTIPSKSMLLPTCHNLSRFDDLFVSTTLEEIICSVDSLKPVILWFRVSTMFGFNSCNLTLSLFVSKLPFVPFEVKLSLDVFLDLLYSCNDAFKLLKSKGFDAIFD